MHIIIRSRPSENLLDFSARGENCSDGKSLLLDIVFDNVAVFIGDERQRQVNLVVPFPPFSFPDARRSLGCRFAVLLRVSMSVYPFLLRRSVTIPFECSLFCESLEVKLAVL